MILVTGGAGFIGGNFIHHWFDKQNEPILVLDKLTYAGHLATIGHFLKNELVKFVQGDICDGQLLQELMSTYNPRAIIHFAAETHVDRSIEYPDVFVQTNIVGTFQLLESAKQYYQALSFAERSLFRFIHVSTDEVYGSLDIDAPPFTETSNYTPNSPYSASKASSDHLARSYFHTYQLPVLITNCSNNYGPYQFPEKLIPLMILKAIAGNTLPIYGDGKNIRDWLFVRDHCEAICQVLTKGAPGETYNIGGQSERQNIVLVGTICDHLDRLLPKTKGSYHEQITFVSDRLGHDRRYAINARKITQEGTKTVNLLKMIHNQILKGGR